MADISNISAGDLLSFDLNTTLIAADYKGVTLLGIVGYTMAMGYEDVEVTHKNIIGSLPEGTPEKASDYNYLIVKLPSGTIKAVGIPWIKDPITVVKTTTITVTVTPASLSDVDIIKKALNAYGVTNYTITTTMS